MVLFGVALILSPAARGITAAELARLREDGASLRLIDVRSSALYKTGSIPGAMSVPAAVLLEKNFAPLGRVVLFCDGLGDVDVDRYVEVLNQRPGVQAEALEGGYAAWLDEGQATTAPTGMKPAVTRMIDYKKMEKIAQPLIMVDLRRRGPPSAEGGRATSGAGTPNTAAAPDRGGAAGVARGDTLATGDESAPGTVDALKEFCEVPGREYCGDLAELRNRFAKKGGARGASGVESRARHEPTPLIVLVDNDYATAAEEARRMRVAGYHRVVVLTGGDLALRTKGRPGLGRVGGKVFEGSFSPLQQEDSK